MIRQTLCLSVLISLSACRSAVFSGLNPFQASGGDQELGKRTLEPLLGEGSSGGQNGAQQARTALQQMATYRAAQPAQPGYPVVQPAEVRLMWIPDHLNKSGDLVPAHYYYLKVLNDRWAVQDAFELESQLTSGGGKAGSGGATPWVYGDVQKRR